MSEPPFKMTAEQRPHQSNSAIQGETPDSEYLAYLNNDIPDEEELHFSAPSELLAEGPALRCSLSRTFALQLLSSSPISILRIM